MTHDCRSVVKHVLKCYDIFFDVHSNKMTVGRGMLYNLARFQLSACFLSDL